MLKKLLAGLAALTLATAAHAQGDQDMEPSASANASSGDAVDMDDETGPLGDGAATTDDPLSDIFARDDFKVTPIICPFKGRIDYKPGEISCGLISVPENRERARSRKIQLHFVKLAAREPNSWDAAENGAWKKRDDAIIYLTGGPGVTVTGYAQRLKDHGARDVRDFYILEQRGVGYSGDYCPLYSNIDPAASNVDNWDAYQRARLKGIEDCFATAKARGVDLSGYNSIENARDVHALRRALGIEKWNVWGISYGSILGQSYLKEDPQGIRAVVLDAIVPLIQGAHFQKIGTFLQRDLDLLEAACHEDKACKASFPDIDGRLKEAAAAIQKRPITVEALDKEYAPTGKVTIFHDIIAGLPFQMFYEQKNYGTMPAFIDALADLVERRDFDAFSALTAGGGGGGISISQGMYNAILCNDGWAASLRKSLEEDQAAHPLLGSIQGDPSIADDLVRICKKYGMATRPAEDYAPVETDIPAIIANGQMDPITPPMLAKMIVSGFSNGTYVEFPYAGHGPTRSVECGGEFVTKFFDNPEGPLDRSCADGMKAPEFKGPLFQTQGPLKLLAFATASPEKAPLVALWFGLPAVFLLYGAFIYMLAPAARLINGATSISAIGAQPLAFAAAFLGAASVLGLALGAGRTLSANEFAVLVGMLGWTRWFALAGLAAGGLGALLLVSTLRARGRGPMPVGVFSGLILTGLSAIGLASFLAVWGFIPN